MKNIITLILFLSIYSCGDSTPEAITDSAAVIANEVSPTNNIIGIPIVIGSLEVAEKDFPNEMNWQSAKNACSNLGKGWRLPTNDELNLLFQNKDNIGGFISSSYWSSVQNDDEYAWGWYFGDGKMEEYKKDVKLYVRAVKTIK
jgi:hypothetical protein